MRWPWDQDKSRVNERNTASTSILRGFVFDDPLMVHRPDPSLDEERWHTIGTVGGVAIIVVHTWPSFVPSEGDEVARIISARKATPHERRAYEEGRFQ